MDKARVAKCEEQSSDPQNPYKAGQEQHAFNPSGLTQRDGGGDRRIPRSSRVS